jgi:hypothetical protein
MWIDNAAFLLMADVENDGQANADWETAGAMATRELLDTNLDAYASSTSVTGVDAVFVKIGT